METRRAEDSQEGWFQRHVVAEIRMWQGNFELLRIWRSRREISRPLEGDQSIALPTAPRSPGEATCVSPVGDFPPLFPRVQRYVRKAITKACE
jgi:hypothetical protein